MAIFLLTSRLILCFWLLFLFRRRHHCRYRQLYIPTSTTRSRSKVYRRWLIPINLTRRSARGFFSLSLSLSPPWIFFFISFIFLFAWVWISVCVCVWIRSVQLSSTSLYLLPRPFTHKRARSQIQLTRRQFRLQSLLLFL